MTKKEREIQEWDRGYNDDGRYGRGFYYHGTFQSQASIDALGKILAERKDSIELVKKRFGFK
jgi:hypothetical protein